MPHDKVEIASFGLSEDMRGFRQVGLGLWTTELCVPGGYTQKVLMNLPGQVLPDHSHRTTLIFNLESRHNTTSASMDVLEANGFVNIHQNVGNFKSL
ncbi:MAG: hypothetical protein AABZ57_05300, partial [Candidatus Margulisiibacteriota bacterium]